LFIVQEHIQNEALSSAHLDAT